MSSMNAVTTPNGTSFGLQSEQVQRDATAVLNEVSDDHGITMQLARPDGRVISFPPTLTDMFMDLLEAASLGGTVRVSTLPNELSTTVAAQELGISRPTLMKLVRNEQLPAFKVGSHTRIRRDDVEAFKVQRENERRSAFKALLDANEDRSE